MKIKKKYSFTDNNQIWRIKLTETDKLFIETRNTDKMEAFFSCLELEDGKPIFTKLQMEEKYWLGVEIIHNDLVLFHKFTKPDMPGHRGIFAFDINTQNIVWENKEYSFLFLLNEKIYAYQEKFEGKKVIILDLNNGKLIEDLGNNPPNVNELKNIADAQINFTKYKFPEIFYGDTYNHVCNKFIDSETNNLTVVGNIEYLQISNFFIFNYHSQSKNKGLVNTLLVCDILKKKVLLKDIINTHLNAFAPDSFFIYKNLLILIKEKNRLVLYDLIE